MLDSKGAIAPSPGALAGCGDKPTGRCSRRWSPDRIVGDVAGGFFLSRRRDRRARLSRLFLIVSSRNAGRLLLSTRLHFWSSPMSVRLSLTAFCVLCLPLTGRAAEVVTISVDNAAEVAPTGKEADWIYGDYVIRNGRTVAVIARPVATRNANMTVRGVGGCIIDLTEQERPNDQLSCFYPAAGLAAFRSAQVSASGGSASSTDGDLTARGQRVVVECTTEPAAGKPQITVAYELADGDDFLTVTTNWKNSGAVAIPVELTDRVRADRSFDAAIDPAANVAWWDDEWFGQTFAILPTDARFRDAPTALKPFPNRDAVGYEPATGAIRELPPGDTVTLVRRIFAAPSLLAARGTAARLAGQKTLPVVVIAKDPAGPVTGAFVTVFDTTGSRYAAGRTDAAGRLAFVLPRTATDWKSVIRDGARGTVERPLAVADDAAELSVAAELPRPGFVVGEITDASGGPIPCKVQFRGRGCPDPDFAPDSSDTAVRNLVYSAGGRFRQEIAPGTYEVVVSYGPEYDAVTTEITVARDAEALLALQLMRVVDTRGWISSDFHSHSTPSGDNTCSQLGRVQNLLCEQVEFAPCTEHNRISSYLPHLERLGVTQLMATCSGMELTGSLLPVNHQNAFPLVEQPHTQDGGGPVVNNDNPVAQIERLALWDDGASKVVQMNHPNLVQVLGDRDTDGTADGGFEPMLGFVDLIEVHPLEDIFNPSAIDGDPRKRTHTVFRWLQMLNLGYRIPGVVNTDAHYSFHGSGWLRNYIASPTDDPAKIRVEDVVEASTTGRLVMTSGPFLEVRAVVDGAGEAGPGQSLAAADGRLTLHVRVQCPNWFDIDRVQVFVNGRPEPALNFTRREQGRFFFRDAVRFEHAIPVRLESDAHLVVATVGEESGLGQVMGPDHAKKKPIAVANPIFIDVDGDGFQANGDLLGVPLPHQLQPTGHRHHGHDHDAPDHAAQ